MRATKSNVPPGREVMALVELPTPAFVSEGQAEIRKVDEQIYMERQGRQGRSTYCAIADLQERHHELRRRMDREMLWHYCPPEEVARILGITTNAVLAIARQGVVPVLRYYGGHWFRRADIDDLIYDIESQLRG